MEDRPSPRVPSYFRKIANEAYARDHGICRKCGINIDKKKNQFIKTANWLIERYSEKYRDPNQSYVWVFIKCIKRNRIPLRVYKWMIAFTDKLGIPNYRRFHNWWEAHHVVPVIENGSNDSSNIITLCFKCHRKETTELHRSRRFVKLGRPKDRSKWEAWKMSQQQ